MYSNRIPLIPFLFFGSSLTHYQTTSNLFPSQLLLILSIKFLDQSFQDLNMMDWLGWHPLPEIILSKIQTWLLSFYSLFFIHSFCRITHSIKPNLYGVSVPYSHLHSISCPNFQVLSCIYQPSIQNWGSVAWPYLLSIQYWGSGITFLWNIQYLR